MSRNVKSNWRIAAYAFALALSLSLIGFYVWAGLAHNRWHWGFIALWAFWGFYLYPIALLKELKKPKELVPGAPDPNEPNLSLFQYRRRVGKRM